MLVEFISRWGSGDVEGVVAKLVDLLPDILEGSDRSDDGKRNPDGDAFIGTGCGNKCAGTLLLSIKGNRDAIVEGKALLVGTSDGRRILALVFQAELQLLVAGTGSDSETNSEGFANLIRGLDVAVGDFHITDRGYRTCAVRNRCGNRCIGVAGICAIAGNGCGKRKK